MKIFIISLILAAMSSVSFGATKNVDLIANSQPINVSSDKNVTSNAGEDILKQINGTKSYTLDELKSFNNFLGLYIAKQNTINQVSELSQYRLDSVERDMSRFILFLIGFLVVLIIIQFAITSILIYNIKDINIKLIDIYKTRQSH